MTSADANSPQLKRSFGLVTLVAFGIGDILGAGVYGLIGDVSAEVGNGVWAAFLVAFVVAAFTGLSYAELGSRLPHSGGEARYALVTRWWMRIWRSRRAGADRTRCGRWPMICRRSSP